MGRRRRKKVRRVRRTRRVTSLRYFECPVCGQPTLTIDFKKADKPGYKLAIVKCGSCHLHLEMEVPELLDRVDVYNRVVDLAYEGKLDEYISRHEGEEEPQPEAPELDELLGEVVEAGEEGAGGEDSAGEDSAIEGRGG